MLRLQIGFAIVVGLVITYFMFFKNSETSESYIEERYVIKTDSELAGEHMESGRKFVLPDASAYTNSLNSTGAGVNPEKHALSEHMNFYEKNTDSGAPAGSGDYVTYARSIAVDDDVVNNHRDWVSNRLSNNQNWTGRTMMAQDWENSDNTNWQGIRGRPQAVPIDKRSRKQIIDIDETQFPTKPKFVINSE
jgi:hypothetical protein